MAIRDFFGRKYLPKTVFIAAAAAVCIWLGLWQLDRLEWRRGLNAETLVQINQPPVDLNVFADVATLPDMVDRAISATGSFDFDQQVILKNQNNPDTGAGVRLIAPFVLDGTNQAIMVDRGWISNADVENVGQLDEALNSIDGVIQSFSTRPTTFENGELFWLNFEQLEAGISYELLPVVLLQTADSADFNARPYRTPHNVELSEGSHLGYAVQWFSFALIFVVGYIFYVRREQSSARSVSSP